MQVLDMGGWFRKKPDATEVNFGFIWLLTKLATRRAKTARPAPSNKKLRENGSSQSFSIF